MVIRENLYIPIDWNPVLISRSWFKQFKTFWEIVKRNCFQIWREILKDHDPLKFSPHLTGSSKDSWGPLRMLQGFSPGMWFIFKYTDVTRLFAYLWRAHSYIVSNFKLIKSKNITFLVRSIAIMANFSCTVSTISTTITTQYQWVHGHGQFYNIMNTALV